MPGLSSPFKTPQGEAEYRVACDATMRLWSVPASTWTCRNPRAP